MYDIIICGGGPAGLSAAIYTGRYGLKTLLLEKMFVGGQVVTTSDIENYPGTKGVVTGFDLIADMEQQAKSFGTEIKTKEITDYDFENPIKKVICGKEEFSAKAVILALGASPLQLGVKDEASLRGRGVSYCATCDGFFYREKTVCVVGGGETAVGEAIYLSKICKKVYLIHRRDSFRASKSVVDKLKDFSNIELVLNSQITEILHESAVTGVMVKNKDGEERTLTLDGVFVAIGLTPNTDSVAGKVNLTEGGYITIDGDMSTTIPGVFAAGDAVAKTFRQIITAASDGATAAYYANEYLAYHEV